MTRLLVTGSAGFIGSAIVRQLEREGADFVALSRSVRETAGSRGRWLAADLLGDDQAALERTLDDTGAEICIHSAWYTNNADYLVHDINRDWLAASIRFEHAFRAAGGRRFVGLGTCLEYDVGAADGPCVEGQTPLAPETFYARCKHALSDAIIEPSRDCAWARVFFVYGPGDREGRLVPWMISQFAQGLEAEPKFGGLKRDYVHVDDLARQILAIARSGVQGPVNVGTGEAPSLSEIFAAGAAAFGRPELARGNDETGGQPRVIAASMERFAAEVSPVGARPVAAGLADLIGRQ